MFASHGFDNVIDMHQDPSRFGNLRQNIGGRPRKALQWKSERLGSNRKKRTDKSERLEVHGDIQAEVTKRCLELSKDYTNSAKGRTEFWKAAKPIMGDITRKRMKKMMGKLDKIEARAAQAKGGIDGNCKRGYHAI